MTSRVLCVSDDEAFASRISAPLEYSYPQVTVFTVTDVAEGVDVIEREGVDAIVTDAGTIADAPALLETVRERRPALSLLVLSSYEARGSTRTAVAEVVDFLEDADDDSILAGWVANSVLDGGRGSGPPTASRMDGVVAAVKRELADATRPGDVETAVCDQLVLADRYEFAWIGEYDRGEGQVVPWGTAARDGSWPRSRTFAAGVGAEGVAARVLRDRTTVVVDDFAGDEEALPWREEAIDRGCESATFVPLETDDELFGVLGVYTTDSDGFDAVERDALIDIADTTARILEGMAIRGRIDQQERTLRRYQRLVETVGDGMYALDADGHFMTVNDALCSMTGYAREGLLGEHVGTILTDDGVEAWTAAVESMTGAAGESRSLELAIETKHGEIVPCENNVGLLPSDEDGQLRGTVGVLRDITERKERERELRRQNERLDAFASIVSHDLRNPLSVAQGYLELAAESATDQESIERVDEALTRMNEMIDDVLELARGGDAISDFDPVYLPSIANSAWSNVEHGDATLSVDADVTIRADSSRLLRLFENLFRNAIQHGDADVSLTVGTIEDGATSVGFYVEDDGPGMSPEVREKVFESQFTTSEQGHGIGLWVVSEVADAHGWEPAAAVGSTGGARFEFTGVERAD